MHSPEAAGGRPRASYSFAMGPVYPIAGHL